MEQRRDSCMRRLAAVAAVAAVAGVVVAGGLIGLGEAAAQLLVPRSRAGSRRRRQRSGSTLIVGRREPA